MVAAAGVCQGILVRASTVAIGIVTGLSLVSPAACSREGERAGTVTNADRDAGDSKARAMRSLRTPRDDAAPPEISAASDAWPLPNHDYDNTRAAFGGRINSATVSELHEVWRIPFDRGGPFGYVTSNPLILGDRVFIQDMQSQVYAIERETGAIRFMYQSDAVTVGPNGVAVGWGKLFANMGDTGIIALDSDDGHVLWRFEPKLIASEGIDLQPIVYGASVFVSTVPASLRGLYLGGSRGVIHALDVSDGHVRWRFDTVASDDLWGDPESNAGGGAWYPPLVDAERKLVYWGTGNPAPWPGSAEQPNGVSRPGDNLYTSSLIALDLEGGQLAWFHQEKPHDLFDWDFQNAPMRVRADRHGSFGELVIGSGKTGTVVALNPDTGKLVWRARVGRHENDDLSEVPIDSSISVYPGALGGVLTATAYAEGVVYVPVVDMATDYEGSSLQPDFASARGALTALDVRDGSRLWSAELPAACFGAATVVNDLVLTSDANGRVYAFVRDTGRELWHYDAPGGINAPLAVADDLLLVPVGIDHGMLIALRLAPGAG
jgi:glucose dehydrogenase